ncbi:MAG: diguanylate cyclase [Pseudomonadales bacterium]|nr:diguanylate cyclase [Pseudomonadales bacterium]
MHHFSRLRRCIDFFIDDTLYHNDDERYRARILAGCLLSIAFISAITCLSISFIYTGSPDNYIGISITAFIMLLYSCLLVVLKFTGKTQYLAYGFSIPLYLSLIVSVFVAGGAEATSSQIMFLLPVMMFFTSGIATGLLWAGIVLITQIIIYAMYWSGFAFEMQMTHAQAVEQSLVHFLVTLTGLTVIAWIYEKANQRLIEERDNRDKDNYFLSRNDLLTGLTNRSAFFAKINHQIAQAKRQKHFIHMLIIDIDNLEQINQTFGYDEADNIIKTFAQRLKIQSCFSHSARLNGKRFALTLLSEDKNSPEASIQTLQQAINQPFTLGHQIVSLQYQLACSSHDADTTVDELMIKAEASLDKLRAA